MYSKTFLVFLVVYFMSDFSRGRRDKKLFRKDYNYIEKFESFYKMHTTPRTFADAKQLCVLEGASLFYSEDDDEANAVLAHYKRVQPSTKWFVLVGLTDSKKEGVFENIDEISIADVYKHWQENEPNNQSSDEDCVILDQEGFMNDVPCSERYRFICKKKDYTYIEAVDSYYKIHSTQRTFAEAKRTCVLEDASLFYPENEKEAHAVIEFWNNTQPTIDRELIVGMSDLMTEGVFETIDGKLIYNVYDQWLNGGPSDVDGSKDCIKLNREGYIHDVSCSEKYRFTCKRLLPPQWNDNCNIANLGQSISDASAWWGNVLPAADDEKKCGSMFYTGLLNNIDCDTKSFFICEHEVDGPTEQPKFSSGNQENSIH